MELGMDFKRQGVDSVNLYDNVTINIPNYFLHLEDYYKLFLL